MFKGEIQREQLELVSQEIIIYMNPFNVMQSERE
jgi:hypothetical protein